MDYLLTLLHDIGVWVDTHIRNPEDKDGPAHR